MNGIPIKITKNTEAGPDVETVYFATMRKCPALRERLRAMMAADNALTISARLYEVALKGLQAANNTEEAEAAGVVMSKAGLALDDALNESGDARRGYIMCGLKATGLYDDASAERIADELPPEGLEKIISASRLGAGALDFCSPSKLEG
jgi:hypothetical protein